MKTGPKFRLTIRMDDVRGGETIALALRSVAEEIEHITRDGMWGRTDLVRVRGTRVGVWYVDDEPPQPRKPNEAEELIPGSEGGVTCGDKREFFTCTRAKGHGGTHAAHGISGVVRVWED